MEIISYLDHISNLQPIKNISTGLKARRNTVYFSTNSNHLSAKYLWNIIGSKLEVYSFEQRCNNRLVASFDFGEIYNDPNIIITNVTRLADRFEVTSQYRHPYKLVVILNLVNGRNLICIVDIRLNCVMNTIHFPFNITCVEVVLSGPKENVQNMPLINELRCMNGCLAVGCEGGLVFFIDLILDSYSPEPLIPKNISMVTHNSTHIEMESKRRTAIFHNQVICLALNTEAKNKSKFNYRTDDGTVLASFQIDQVYISSLHYVPQLSLICIGYNFGGFHLYNLNVFNLECSCDIDPDLLPVIAFAYQSPENDPKNYSYLWVVRGLPYRVDNIVDNSPMMTSQSSAFIYLLCYQNKKTVENYGILYDTFKLCCCKFELPFSSNYEKNINQNCSSKLLDIFTIHQMLPSKSEDDDTTMFQIDFNYLFIAWETNSGKNHNSNFYFCIFDLNQWYKTQMQKSICLDKDGLCPFLSIYSMNTLSKALNHNTIQAIYFPNITISKFTSSMFYADIHSYPSSLSFNIFVASNSQLCNVAFNGLQKRMILQLNSASNLKDIVDDSQEILSKCLKCGLIPSDFVLQPDDTKSNMFQLMNVALENNLSTWLLNFIKDESTYLNSDLQLLLEWIWNKVESIKCSIDLLTKPLFDLTGSNVSQQDISKLVSYGSHLDMLSILLKQLLYNSTSITNMKFDKLQARIEVVDLIRHYLKFILQFENLGLLPEQSGNRKPFYLYEKVSEFYCKRRQTFKSINANLFNNNDILLIDILVKHFDLSGIWKIKDNENAYSSLYPPKDLCSLLQILLMDSIPLIYKESILLYFIYDLNECLCQEHPLIAQKLMIFTTSLNIQQGVRNFVDGLRCLDHQDYDQALNLFIHPIVTSSLGDFKVNIQLFDELMQRIIEMFLFENQFKKAMILTMTCNHILLDQEQSENLYIQILLLNGNLSGAMDFQRKRRSENKSYQLLYKLYFVCEKMNSLVQICRLPLDSFEENVFIDYLLNSSYANAKIILVLYFIVNNKLIDAMKIVEEYSNEFNANDEHKNIMKMIDSHISILPSSAMTLAKEIQTFIQNNNEVQSKQDDNDLHKDFNNLSSSFHKRKNESSLRKPLYLSPGMSKCRITKTKHQSPARKLFDILKTPERKERLLNEFETTSVSKKPILKLPSNSSVHSETDSECGHKLKVSFSSETLFENDSKLNGDLIQETEIQDGQSVNESPAPRNMVSTPNTKKSKFMKKTMDSPSHRMTLRSNKKY